MALPRIADLSAGEWQEHPRFHGIYMKALLGPVDNPLASVSTVRVPPGGLIGLHRHTHQFETVCLLSGHAILILDRTEVLIGDGQVVVIPPTFEHALRNDSSTLVELLTFFTPPLT